MKLHKFACTEVPTDHGDAFPDIKTSRRPILTAKLLHAGRQVEYPALVDSGADFCIFPMSFATQLGLPMDDAKRVPGITGFGYRDASDLFFWPVTLQIGEDFSVTTLIGFSVTQNEQEFGILGQQGFFSEVTQVKFSHPGACFGFVTGDPTDIAPVISSHP